ATLSVSRYISPRLPRPPLFPYTTLFRSVACRASCGEPTSVAGRVGSDQHGWDRQRPEQHRSARHRSEQHGGVRPELPEPDVPVRSEEHTSELQSRENLVCRLLLEKEKPT